jgi:hypothetical protein
MSISRRLNFNWNIAPSMPARREKIWMHNDLPDTTVDQAIYTLFNIRMFDLQESGFDKLIGTALGDAI